MLYLVVRGIILPHQMTDVMFSVSAAADLDHFVNYLCLEHMLIDRRRAELKLLFLLLRKINAWMPTSVCFLSWDQAIEATATFSSPPLLPASMKGWVLREEASALGQTCVYTLTSGCLSSKPPPLKSESSDVQLFLKLFLGFVWDSAQFVVLCLFDLKRSV